MLRSMYSAISGMQSFETKLDVIGNNIANVNTTGFKSGRVDFSDVLSQTINGGSKPTANTGGTNPQQIGLGVHVAAIQTLFTQGADQSTGNPTDLAINGGGMFVVQSNGNTYLTRAGNFTLDSNYNLVLPDGSIAMGYDYLDKNPPSQTPKNTNPRVMNLNTMVTDFNTVNGTTWQLASAPDIQIGQDGSISVAVVNGGNTSRITVGNIALATVPNPGGLLKVGDTLYQTSNNSGSATYQVAGTNNTGTIAAGYLEMSNVDLTREFTEMIVAQRGFDANSKMIGTDNAILQDIVNLKNA
jgi:flagellar hook protein FlgE